MIFEIPPREGKKSVLSIYRELREEYGLEGSGLLGKAVFGYDMRFLFPEVKNIIVDELAVYFKAIEVFSKPKFAIFSHDQRMGWEKIKEAFGKYCSELSDVECFTVEGILPSTTSPFLLAALSQHMGRGMSVHATASHNSWKYNGIKSFYGKFRGEIVGEKIELEEEEKADRVAKLYADFLLDYAQEFDAEFTFDFLHGSGWVLMKHILPKIAKKVKILNEKPLPDFGGKAPRPPVEHSMKFGFVADGDMDRIALYYSSRLVPFSIYLAILAELGLAPPVVVVDQKAAPVVIDFMEERGIKVVLGDIGRTNQERIARKYNAMWCEENWHSGGYEIKKGKIYWTEAPLGFLNVLRNIGSIGVNRFFRIKVPEVLFEKFELEAQPGMNTRLEKLAPELFKEFEVKKIPSGGVRVETGEGHFIVRESHTEKGVVRVYATGTSMDELKANVKRARDLIASAKNL